MKISVNDMKLNSEKILSRKIEQNNISKTKNENNKGVSNKIDVDLIDKMGFIENAMKIEEEVNLEKIKEIKNKIEKDEYSVNPKDILNSLGGI